MKIDWNKYVNKETAHLSARWWALDANLKAWWFNKKPKVYSYYWDFPINNKGHKYSAGYREDLEHLREYWKYSLVEVNLDIPCDINIDWKSFINSLLIPKGVYWWTLDADGFSSWHITKPFISPYSLTGEWTSDPFYDRELSAGYRADLLQYTKYWRYSCTKVYRTPYIPCL